MCWIVCQPSLSSLVVSLDLVQHYGYNSIACYESFVNHRLHFEQRLLLSPDRQYCRHALSRLRISLLPIISINFNSTSRLHPMKHGATNRLSIAIADFNSESWLNLTVWPRCLRIVCQSPSVISTARIVFTWRHGHDTYCVPFESFANYNRQFEHRVLTSLASMPTIPTAYCESFANHNR